MTSHAEWLRALGHERLSALLTRRPDVTGTRPPTTVEQLAQQLATPWAAGAGLAHLDRSIAQTAAVLAGAGRATAAQVAALLSRTDPVSTGTVQCHLAAAAEVGLCWQDIDGRWLPVAGLMQQAASLLGLDLQVDVLRQLPMTALRTFTRALGLPAVSSINAAVGELARFYGDPVNVLWVLAQGPAGIVDQARRVDAGLPAEAAALRWLAQRGMALNAGHVECALLTEVALALREDRLVPAVVREPTGPTRPAQGFTAGADAATGLVEQCDALLTSCETSPPEPLRSGGIGVREVRRLAKQAGCTQEQMAARLELLGQARLLTVMDRPGRPTSGVAAWRSLSVQKRWEQLVRVAVDSISPVLLGFAGVPLQGYARHDEQILPTSQVLRGLVRLGAVSQPPDTLASWLEWSRCMPGSRSLRLDVLKQQLALLGTVGLAGVEPDGWLTATPWGLALSASLSGADADPAAALAAQLPPEQERAVLQADATAVVAGRPAPGLQSLLDLLGSRESDRVWRLSAGGVRQALDLGRTEPDLLAELTARSERAVPQVLTQLIRDVAARYGRIRVGPAATVLEVADEPTRIGLLRDKKLASLHLRVVAGAVLASDKPQAAVFAALRAAGHAPAPDGSVVTAAPARPAPPLLRAPRAIDHRELAARLLATPPPA